MVSCENSDSIILKYGCHGVVSISSGSSENVNYAVHTLCGLLTTYGLLKEIYLARLPVGHTHIDIDGRHAIFSMHFNGTKDSGGHVVNGIMTPAEFDRELKAPYKTDRVTVFRKYGLLAFGEKVKSWLNFTNYGTPSKNSVHAKEQGGRDPEAHFFTYFKEADDVCARMRYKFLETDVLSLPRYDGIEVIVPECFSDAMDLLDGDIVIKEMCEWSNRAAVEASIRDNKDLNPEQVSQWEDWFSSCPITADDIPYDSDAIIEWPIKKLLARKRKYIEEQRAAYIPWKAHHDESAPFPHEIIVHPGHTKKALNAEKKHREDTHHRRKAIEAEAEVVAAVIDGEKRASKRKR